MRARRTAGHRRETLKGTRIGRAIRLRSGHWWPQTKSSAQRLHRVNTGCTKLFRPWIKFLLRPNELRSHFFVQALVVVGDSLGHGRADAEQNWGRQFGDLLNQQLKGVRIDAEDPALGLRDDIGRALAAKEHAEFAEKLAAAELAESFIDAVDDADKEADAQFTVENEVNRVARVAL